jgi:type VI secretion system protein ImpF
VAELSQREKLQPSLLDRLTDEEPERLKEAPDRRFLTLERLRAVVKRDLAWLLNTGNLASIQDLTEYPEVERSVINYGMRDLTGSSLSGVDVAEIEQMVKQAIIDFEPRILPDSVRVRATVDRNRMSQNAVNFVIEGELWAYPAPVDIVLQSEVDLESGLVNVRD